MAKVTLRNLLIIINPRFLDPRDFEEIARRTHRINKRINIYLLSFEQDIANVPGIDWRLPTLTVSLCPEVRSEPRRGYVLYCRRIDKLAQINAIKAAGIRVPMTSAYDRTTHYDPAVWGDFVIVKSYAISGSSSGQTAHLTPTRHLSTPDRFADPVKSILLSGSAAIQEFIPTGPHPTNHRVCLFLGRILYLLQSRSPLELPQLDPDAVQTHLYDSNYKELDQFGGRQMALIKDRAMIALADKIAKVFPGIPLMGLDILRNEDTGAIYPIEINAGGNTWHFSSPSTTDGRAIIPREERIAQFGAWNVAAEALVAQTLKWAQ
jgi:hypothetical protein